MGYDVAVIGAGVHGCAAAAHLAARGASVIVVDKGGIAGGPTGRSSAVCWAYYSQPFLARVARDSLEVLANFHEWSDGGQSGFRKCGLLFLHPEQDGPRLIENARALAEIGTAVEVLDRAALATRHPEISLDGIGYGVWEEGGGPADPSGTTAGLWAMAKARGATIRLNDRVERISLKAGDGVQLKTESTVLEADRLLIAAGPWTKQLGLQVGADLPLTVERHYVTTNSWGSTPPLEYGLADVTGGFYLIPELTANFSIGQLFEEPTVDPDHFLEAVTPFEQEHMASAAMWRVPGLLGSAATGGWASLYDVSPDWQPVIGEIAPSIFVDAGTSGHGFKLAPVLGRYVADLVLDGVADPGLDAFHPRRFLTGEGLSGGYGSARILG